MSGGPGNPNIAKYAKRAAAASKRQRMTLTNVEAQLGALETPDDAKRWIRQAYVWGTSGRIAGTMANACSSLMREWIKAHDLHRITARIRELELEVEQLRKAAK